MPMPIRKAIVAGMNMRIASKFSIIIPRRGYKRLYILKSSLARGAQHNSDNGSAYLHIHNGYKIAARKLGVAGFCSDKARNVLQGRSGGVLHYCVSGRPVCL